VEVVDVNQENGSCMNHESAAMSESYDSDSSKNDVFDKNRQALSFTDVDFLITKLRLWSNQHKLSHACLSDLLKILKMWFVELPSHSRTVLGTKTDFNVQNIAGGEYIHISIKHALPIALKHASVSAEQLFGSTLKLQLNFDGVPMFGSNNYSVWPVLAKIVDPVKTKVFAVGVFGGKKKPSPFNDYLRPLVDELRCINAEGGVFLNITNSHLPIVIHNICCDAAARGSVRNVHSFNFHSGCDRCKVQGKMIEHRMTFTDLYAKPRLDTDFDVAIDSDDEDEYRVGNCILRDVGVGMVTNFPYDYMHLVCLGVVRNMATMLHSGRNGGRLTGAVIAEISKHMAVCVSHIPKEFQRQCRTLFESGRWKATECRQFLLYSGLVVLNNTGVARKQYENFLYLSAAIRCLCSEELITLYMDFVQSALQYFISQFGEIYGRQYVVYNVHSLNHLPADAQRFGTLDNFSCFEYESFLGVVKELTHKRKPSHVVQQICRRLSEREFLVTSKVDYQDEVYSGSGVTQKQHTDGPTLTGLDKYIQYQKIVWNGQLISLKDSDSCVMLDGNVCVVRNILKPSEHSSSITILFEVFGVQTDFFTLPLNPGPDFVGSPLQSGSIGIWKVGRLANNNIMHQAKMTKFKSVVKCVLLPTSTVGEFVAMPMLHNL
jgi:hypothetical protein